MCRSNNVCSTVYKLGKFSPPAINDFYDIGVQTLKEKRLKPGSQLDNLRPSTIGVADPTDHRNENDESETVSEGGDEEPEINDNEPQTEDDEDENES
ncbi:hypothetical protein Pst134EA_005598 [Puccinia striiformis f. sp. tritici]|nr:hypothetical protein Pst134EA_005598 [Puccinia striiformis f. sp. tritici]KAH9471719.1 hypothetical protein Pst134EA_005598 [Puccinia striiformis f. sp. tritici]KAI9618794.1 hypothetical protein H4Q26_012048 [Puccinia striiformis f. sp. tritici PST-130]